MNNPRIILVVILIFGLNNVVFAQPDMALARTAIPEIQAQIRTTVLAFLSDGNSEPEVKTNWKGYRELAKLKELAEDDEHFVKQLAVYAVIEPRDEQWQVMEALLVLQQGNLKPTTVIRLLAPYLDSENPLLRELAQDWFQSHDICGKGPSNLLSLNYADYLDYVRGQFNRNEEVSTAFIEYLYERSPGLALSIFTHANPTLHAETTARLLEMQKKFRADWQKRKKTELDKRFPPKVMSEQEIKEFQQRVDQQPNKLTQEERKQHVRGIVLAEHLVSHAIWLQEHAFGEQFPEALPAAKEQLSMLAEQDQWWARLYVVHIMRRHRELQLDDVLEKLSSDSNELVSKSAKNSLSRR